MLSVTNKSIMLNVIILSAFNAECHQWAQYVVILNIVMLNAALVDVVTPAKYFN
jgi:hypothetical protein